MAEELKGTEYVVQRAVPVDPDHPSPLRWELIEEGDLESGPVKVRAANDIAAIKAMEALLGTKFDYGAVAIPSRSWRPRVPKDEMVPRRLWS